MPAHNVLKTVWNDLPGVKVDVQIDEFDQLFAISNTNPDLRSKMTSNDAKNNKKNATLIDLQRAQNVAILLSRIRLTFPQIRTALLDVDALSLTLDNLKAIRSCLPTADEMELVREYKGDFTTLSKADNFFKEVLGIPKLTQRVDCMIYMRRFELDMEELKPDVQTVRMAVDEIRKSDKLRMVLKHILFFGNILNNKTFRGEARGFSLADLPKLRETRASVPGNQAQALATPTLLHYLVKALNREDESLVGFLDTCEHVEAAARINTQSIAASIAAMAKGLADVNGEVQALQRMQISLRGDRFVQLGEAFIKMASPQVEALQLAHSAVARDAVDLMRYFGEDDRASKPEDFFGIIGSFGQALMRAEVELREKESQAAKQKKKSHPPKDAPAPAVVTTALLNSLKDVQSKEIRGISSESEKKSDCPVTPTSEKTADEAEPSSGTHTRDTSSATIRASDQFEANERPRSRYGSMKGIQTSTARPAHDDKIACEIADEADVCTASTSPSSTRERTSRYGSVRRTLSDVGEDVDAKGGSPVANEQSLVLIGGGTLHKRTVGRVAAAARQQDKANALLMASGEPGAGSIMGSRGQLDEALKELRTGQNPNGTLRKSLRHKTVKDNAHRPLSRVFLDS